MIVNTFLTLVGGFLLIAAGVIRFLRWASIVQQKEYRWDRLALFLKTDAGHSEIVRLLPILNDFSRSGLKRPKLTARASITMLVAAVVNLLVLLAVMFLVQSLVLIAFAVVMIYLLIPVSMIVSGFSTVWIRVASTYWYLWRAGQLLKRNDPIVIGIAGPFGKTSTKQLLSHVLSEKFSTFATPSSYNTALSVAKAVVDGYDGQEIAILEYGSYKTGEIEEMTHWMEPDHAIITGFSPQHLGLFGSEEAIIEADAELVRAVPSQGSVLVNAQYQGAVAISKLGGHSDFIPYSTEDSPVQLGNVSLNKYGQLQFQWNEDTVETRLVGEMHTDTVRAVISMSEQLGLSSQEIISGLESFKPTERFMRVCIRSDANREKTVLILDDGLTSNSEGYKAMKRTFDALSMEYAVPSTLVFNGIVDLDYRSEEIHRELGEMSKDFDAVWYFSEVGRAAFREGLERMPVRAGETQTDLKLDELVAMDVSREIDGIIVLEGKMPGWFRPALEKLFPHDITAEYTR